MLFTFSFQVKARLWDASFFKKIATAFLWEASQ
jgi:hypothetical protein